MNGNGKHLLAQLEAARGLLRTAMTENSARILAALFYGLGLPAVGPMHDRRGLAGQRTAVRCLMNKGALRPDLTVTDNGVRLLADYLRGIK